MTKQQKRLAGLGALLLVVLYICYRLFVHSTALLTPAVITPEMNAHRVLAPSLDARVYRLTHEPKVVHYTGKPRLIALTFDDGPYPVTTPLLLAVLSDLHVPATFFLIGRDAELQPELTARIVQRGFEVANHTYTHPRMDLLPRARVRQELLDGATALHAFTKAKTVTSEWRPPHGRYTEATIATAQQLGYTTVLWNDDPGDYRIDQTAEMLRTHIEAHSSVPEILLLHSGVLSTIEMLPQIVAEFRAKGFTFVTVSTLFAQTPLEQINHPAHVPLR